MISIKRNASEKRWYYPTWDQAATELQKLFRRRIEATAIQAGEKVGEVVRMNNKWNWYIDLPRN